MASDYCSIDQWRYVAWWQATMVLVVGDSLLADCKASMC